MPDFWEKAPAYLRIKKAIADEIDSGALAAHSKLPSEDELCLKFGVSRGTVRQALSELVNDGYIYKRHGRGTFVRAREYEHLVDTSRFISILDDLVERGITPKVDWFDIQLSATDETERSYLHADRMFAVQRIRSVSDKPIMYSINRIPYDIFPAMMDTPLDFTSIHTLLKYNCGVKIVNGTRLMQAVAADEKIAGYLKIPVGHPLMLVEQIAYDDHNRCVDYAHLWLRSDLFHVTVNMGRSPQRSV